MDKNQSLSNRLSEVLLNGTWIANTNIKDQIESVTWNEAIYKVNDLNTIALLTFHINYYLEGLNHFFTTGNLEISDAKSFDMPTISTEDDWKALVSLYLTNAKAFIGHVESLSTTQLNQTFVDKKYGSYQRNIEGMIEHCYYHLGQISLLKKLVRNIA